MVLPYNLTNISSANDVYNIITATNDLVGGGFLAAVMLIIWLLILVNYKKENFKIVLVVASFMMVILSTLAFTLDWVNITFVILPVVLTLGSLLMYYFIE